MKKLIIILCISMFFGITSTQAQDAMYIHQKVGGIVKIPVSNVDSVIFYAVLPSLTTTATSAIGVGAATSGGVTNSDGGEPVTDRGVCWSISNNPAVSDSKTSDGSGVGSFVSSITGLSPGTTYYVRAYATNNIGTAYGNEVSFQTLSLLFGEVYNPATGKIWMDRNLGATQVATSSTDAASYGALYQWGRGADGHQLRTSSTTTTLSSTDTPGHANFILSPNHPFDWRSMQNDNLWQGVNGVNNPCPSGFRMPTEIELDAECASWSSKNTVGAFASPLKLPVAGYRQPDDGSLIHEGYGGLYWSSTVSGLDPRFLTVFDSDAYMLSNLRGYGSSVRCIKD